MHLRRLVILIGVLSLWRVLASDPEAVPPEVGAAAPEAPVAVLPAAGAEAGRDWSRLDPSRILRQEPPPEPPADPLVPCHLGGDEPDTFLRSAECERRGGRILEEPAWAKIDPPATRSGP